jgi:D-alanine-D-alanine ligase-like ATP-grasp enzyme
MQSPYSPRDWQHLIPDIERVITEMEKTSILSVGITPYTRIIPSFFLKNYSIYTVQRSSDVDIMEKFVRMHVLQDHHPEIAKKVHGTGYLIGNHMFQAFLKSRKVPPKLMFYTMTDKIVESLDKLGISWIGNNPDTFRNVMLKGPFKQLIRDLGLPIPPSKVYPRAEFFECTYQEVTEECGGSFVVQRADKEVGGNEGTFFIHDDADFRRCLSMLSKDTSFEQIVATRFIEGWSTSMLGCVMPQGILSGPMQLQLIDVPEALHGVPPNGVFFGNDIGFAQWPPETEARAQEAVDKIGAHLKVNGYKGIFGIDFLYDKSTGEIFANECNPRFTGSLVLYSLMLLEAKVPPMEFFHLMAHLDIDSFFNFDKVNEALKVRLPCSHIAFSPKGITSMELPLKAGVYSYDPLKPELSYKGAGISLHDLKSKNDFMLIDTVPSLGGPIEQNVPRLFKFIFNRSVAKSSYEIDEAAGFLVKQFANKLLKAVQNKKENAPAA